MSDSSLDAAGDGDDILLDPMRCLSSGHRLDRANRGEGSQSRKNA